MYTIYRTVFSSVHLSSSFSINPALVHLSAFLRRTRVLLPAQEILSKKYENIF
jgi:hypothetical protein